MIYVVATLVVNEPERDSFVKDAHTVIQATRAEPGCLHYDLLASITDPLTFTFVERWEDRNALDSHFGTPHLQQWREVCAKYVASRRVEVIQPAHVDVL